MHNPTFSFEIGKPVNDSGRWVEGRVCGDKDGYTLEANLCFSQGTGDGVVQMHRLNLRVDRAFSPTEFARLIQPLRSGRFATATNASRVTEVENAGGPIGEIEAGLTLDFNEVTDPPRALKKYGASVGRELDMVTKRELLGRAFMMLGSRPG